MEPYRFKGKVVKGNGIGKGLGFPTANFAGVDAIQLRDGVYAVTVFVSGELYKGMANLGSRPSVAGTTGDRVLEINIFGLEKDLYDLEITVEFYRYIREERKFGSAEELAAQIAADRETVNEYFNTFNICS